MKVYQAEHSISLMAQVLKLSRSGYYSWLNREESKRHKENRHLTDRIKEIHLEERGIFGAPRIYEKLVSEGYQGSKNRIARLMKKAKIMGVTRRKKWRTTIKDDKQKNSKDLVNRQFTAEKANQLWVADITHIPTRTKPLYLAIVMDVWSRKVVGWSMKTSMPAELVISALEMAIKRRSYPVGVIHHSDQGSQYTSELFKSYCRTFGVKTSMGSVGDCYDNAMAESFFATLEAELLNIVPLFKDPEHAQEEIFKYIEGFYNERRLHSKLNYMTPNAFESMHEMTRVA